MSGCAARVSGECPPQVRDDAGSSRRRWRRIEGRVPLAGPRGIADGVCQVASRQQAVTIPARVRFEGAHHRERRVPSGELSIDREADERRAPVSPHILMDAKKTAKRPSMTMTRKIAFTTEAVVCWPRDSALPPTFRPSRQATRPIAAAMKGALYMPTSN